jgi:hypothetical protein
MSGRKPRLPRGGATAGSVYRDLWETSLDACFLLRCERDAAGHVTDFVFADMNPRGAATLGLARDAAVGRLSAIPEGGVRAVATRYEVRGPPVAKTSNG